MAKHEDKCRYSPSQMEALTALCDTLLPSIHLSDHHQKHLHGSVNRFFQASASATGAPQRLAEMLTEKIQHPMIFLSGLGMWALSTCIGTFILCGTKSLSTNFPYFQKFSRISLENRRLILLSWSDSSIFFLRLLYTAIKIFTHLVFFTQVLSNAIYKSVEHRVIVNSGQERISLAYFYNPKSDLLIQPAKELVTPEKPPLYPARTFDEYRLYIRTKGPKGKSQLGANSLKPPR